MDLMLAYRPFVNSWSTHNQYLYIYTVDIPYYPEQASMGAYRSSMDLQGVGAYIDKWALMIIVIRAVG